jgi:hypothetical protein
MKKVDLAKDEAWRRGLLRWKLDPNQQKIYDTVKSQKGGSFYLNKARRIGGSYFLAALAIEVCLSKPDAQVKYAAPTAKAVRKIIAPNIRKILRDCPKELRPKFSLIEGEWKFPNGSTLAIAGCDNQQYENLRGTEADFICLDEVGFMDELDYILNDVLMPQVQDTNGLIVLASTPPRSPAHESFKIAMAHKASGKYHLSTVWDNPRRSKDQHAQFFRQMADSKGMTLDEFYGSTTFRREYLGEFIADEERSVVPEWNQAIERHITQRALESNRPDYCDRYISLDIGWRDGMAALFGYWDYRNARLVIEDEILLFKKTAEDTAHIVSTKALELWAKDKPYLCVADNNLQTIADINLHSSKFGLTFIPTRKDDKELQVNNLREWIRGYKIYIHPRCRRLLTQLGSTIWNKARTSYERNSEGHGDLLDALVYLVRNVRRDRNPFPSDYGVPKGFDIFPVSESTSMSGLAKGLQGYFVQDFGAMTDGDD